MVQDAAPPPAMGTKVEPVADGALEARPEDEGAPEKDDEDDGGAWDTASLYEEILDEVEAFEYSTNGSSRLQCAPHYGN